MNIKEHSWSLFVDALAKAQRAGAKLVKGSGAKIGMNLLVAEVSELQEDSLVLASETHSIAFGMGFGQFGLVVDAIYEKQEEGIFVVEGSGVRNTVYTVSCSFANEVEVKEEDKIIIKVEPVAPVLESPVTEDKVVAPKQTPKPKAKASTKKATKPKKVASKKKES